MNELERRIEKLEHQLKDKQAEINVADELQWDELNALQVELNMSEDLRRSDWRWGMFWNGVLTCVIIGFVFWTATHICQT